MTWLVLSLLCLVAASQSQELIQNGEMETMTGWSCPRAKCALTDAHHGGSHGIKVSERQRWKSGLLQTVPNLQANKSYTYSVWVKMVNDMPGKLGVRFRMSVYHVFTDKTRKTSHISFNNRISVADGWVQLRGDFTTPNKNIASSKLLVYGPEVEVVFVVDDASLQQIADWPNWLEDTKANIKRLRTSPINIKMSVDGNVNRTAVEIKVTQLKKSYPFGTAIGCDLYHHGDKRYADFIHAHFNWATTENALKWKLMEKKKHHINDKRPMRALKKLKLNGIKVRGHNIFWATTPGTPTWIRSLKGADLKEAVKTRINGVVVETKDYLEHWDVNNENLHGFFFEEGVNDARYNLEMFNMSHHAAPNVKMFLNDYAVVSRIGYVGAYLTQALQFKQANVGLYGIGVEGHFNGGNIPHLNVVKSRLDTLAEAGVPIWITEFSVQNNNESIRADHYEQLLRVFYSHPAVEGIIFWGFWSKKHFQKDTASLVSGNEWRINTAGQRVLDLYEKEWMTNESHKLTQSGDEFTVDGFHGDYEVKVMYQGKELLDQTKTFTLESSPITLSLTVTSEEAICEQL